MKEATVKLAGAAGCQEAIGGLRIMDPLTIVPLCEDELIVRTSNGAEVGRLTRASWVAQDVADGKQILHASVNSVGEEETASGSRAYVRVRVATGEAGDTYEMPPIITRSYPVGLVGEQHYQAEIALAQPGGLVQIFRETGNPHDELALVVVAEADSVLGYIPLDSFVRRAVHGEGRGCSGHVKSIVPGGRGWLQVVIDVELGGCGCAARPYRAPKAAAIRAEPEDAPSADLAGMTARQEEPPRSWLARLLGR
jgi:hypothetical protein